MNPDELLAKCDRILDFEDGDARSFTVQFAEEVKAVVVPLRTRLEAAVPFVKAAAEEAFTGPEWAKKAQAWLDGSGLADRSTKKENDK